MVKFINDSISAILFRITYKGYLPHYSYIFRKPEPLGTEIKNVAFSRLGTMLHLEIQKGKEDTKASNFQQETGGTSGCIKRLIMDTKGCNQLMSNDTYFSDSWFSGVTIAEEVMSEGVDYCEGFLSGYIRKVDERLAGSVVSCSEE